MSDVPAVIRATRERLATKPPAHEFPVIPDFPTPGEEDFCPRCGSPLVLDSCERRKVAPNARRPKRAKSKEREGRDQEALPLA